jgi:hypothetical protein
MISVGGGLQIPLMEGDKIRIESRSGATKRYWFPLCNDGKTLDLSRANKGPRSERYLHPRFFRRLREGNYLVALDTTEFTVRAVETIADPVVIKQPELPQPAATGKRRPLLRLPVWGLPPRWR